MATVDHTYSRESAPGSSCRTLIKVYDDGVLVWTDRVLNDEVGAYCHVLEERYHRRRIDPKP